MSETPGQDTTTIFGQSTDGTTTTSTGTSTTQPTVILPEEVQAFVGEGKKYATIEAALKSVPHAQTFIEEQKKQLEAQVTELNALKEELSKRKGMEEYLEALKNQSTGGQQQFTLASTVDIGSIVKEKLTEIEAAKIKESNLETVDATMKETYGEKAKEVFVQKATELNVSVEYLTSLAAKSPMAFFKVFGIENKTNKGMKSSGSVNTEGFTSEQQKPSARIGNKVGASTADMVSAWKNARPTE